MTATLHGFRYGGASRDEQGHRTYKLISLVKTTSLLDGPSIAFTTPGLPQTGSPYSVGNDIDVWAFCTPETTVSYYGQEDDAPEYWWTVEHTFTTKWGYRCRTTTIEDPLLEPDRVSGSFSRFQKEVEKDRNGNLIESSSHETLRGIMKEANRPTITIEQTVPNLELSLFASMVNTVNDAPLWGLAARQIMLVNVSWERRLYGVCNFYFIRRLEFEIDYDGWDPDEIADKGYRCLKGEWTPVGNPTTWTEDAGLNQDNLAHYMIARDIHGEIEPDGVLLDGTGSRLTNPNNPHFLGPFEVQDQSNFLLLNIPTAPTFT